MNNNGLLSIGELANACKVSHKTLRYYDDIGILKPSKVNQENGYRYYSKWQISRIMMIKELQSLGISLIEIKRCLEKQDNDSLLIDLTKILESKESDIKNQMLILNQNLKRISLLKGQYEKIKKILEIEKEQKIIVKKLDKRRIICKEYIGTYNPEVFRLYYKDFLEKFRETAYVGFSESSFPIAIYSQVADLTDINIKLGFETDAEDYIGDASIYEIKDSYYVSYLHKGNYNTLREDAYNKLYKFIEENRYEINGPSIEIYYISENAIIEHDYYITEVQIPIMKK